MSPYQQAAKAAGLDDVPRGYRPGDKTVLGSVLGAIETAYGAPCRVATCRQCPCIVAGTHLGPTCPNGHEWTVRDADDLNADPELRRLAAGFALPSEQADEIAAGAMADFLALPEDDERRRHDAGAALRFERRDEA